jgi:hypothetical protein
VLDQVPEVNNDAPLDQLAYYIQTYLPEPEADRLIELCGHEQLTVTKMGFIYEQLLATPSLRRVPSKPGAAMVKASLRDLFETLGVSVRSQVAHPGTRALPEATSTRRVIPRYSWSFKPTASILTIIAIRIAGNARAQELRVEWRGHMAGLAREGLSPRHQVSAAVGFMRAAVSFRCQDAVDWLWRIAEQVMKSRLLSNTAVLIPTWMAVLLVWRHEGLFGVLDHCEGVISIGGCLYALIHAGRRYRDVKPPKPEKGRGGDKRSHAGGV